MKKLFVLLGTCCAFLFAFIFGSVAVFADELPEATEPTTEIVESETTETTNEEEKPAEEGKDYTFELNEETIEAIKNAISDVSKGDIEEAYRTLKVTIGWLAAMVALCVLVALAFAIKYFKKSALYNAILKNVDVKTDGKISNAMDKIESKVDEMLVLVQTKISENDSAKRKEAQEQIASLTASLDKAKETLK